MADDPRVTTLTFERDEAATWAGPAGWDLKPARQGFDDDFLLPPRRPSFRGAWRSAKVVRASSRGYRRGDTARESTGNSRMVDSLAETTESIQQEGASVTSRSFPSHRKVEVTLPLHPRPPSQASTRSRSSMAQTPLSARPASSRESRQDSEQLDAILGSRAVEFIDRVSVAGSTNESKVPSQVPSRGSKSGGSRSSRASSGWSPAKLANAKLEDILALKAPPRRNSARGRSNDAMKVVHDIQLVYNQEVGATPNSTLSDNKEFKRTTAWQEPPRLDGHDKRAKRINLDHSELLEPNGFTLTTQSYHQW
eukprot:CAMPEP_0197655146 /NCGR_PEP_ID=MMETSP1338-20131121/39277_1 /TAXON_ID=43686 ORGANISM="Pelagodinium beii, Strain RCC1491" /NCGR_SAMPLE_ID=MMETSP1338 /ASSEMBLY_ACC=CAM_ASM_000754 /LENGTH=308 /DNA_ID=CAMNT_0043230735 /DNA_START=24 /DNA_END=947 /DNA_ORIENTATION=-